MTQEQQLTEVEIQNVSPLASLPYEEMIEEISKPVYYNNRELSWLAFNERVLEEAEDETNPLL